MKSLLYSILLAINNCICLFSFSQQKAGDLNIKQINSVDWENFEVDQIKPFKEILEEKNLLILSEADHGDGSSYDAQCMIMKGLIDSSRINTIYTESSWMIIDKINSILEKDGIEGIKSTIPFMRSIELKYWVSNGFWNYLAHKIIQGEVVLRGFDVGASNTVVRELLNEAIELESVKKYVQYNPKDFEEIKFDYENFDGWGISSIFGEDGYRQQKEFVDSVISGYKVKSNLYRIKQWQSLLDFFYWMYQRSLLLKGNKYVNMAEGEKQESHLMSIRDSLVASYFLRDYSKSNNIKAIALMSSYHAMHNSDSVQGLNDCCKCPSTNIMGETLYRELGNEMYNMCFITSSGFRGINYYFFKNDLRKIPKPKKGSLEYTLNQIPGLPYAIIDFKSSSLNDSSYYMSPVFNRYLKSKWSKNFSGIFYIRKMEGIVLGKEHILKSK